MEGAPQGYLKFKSYTPELNCSEESMETFFKSVEELDPFVDSYHFMYQGCPCKSCKTHMSVVFNFKQPLNSSEFANVSEECKQMWKLTSAMDDVLQRKPEEVWRFGCIVHMGIPPIQRAIPGDVLKDLVVNTDSYHIESWSSCYNSSVA